MKYYKISPEWAKKLNVTQKAPMHPDGWHLVLPTFALPLMRMLSPDEYGELNSLDEAIEAIGGCIYNEAEALASYKGEESYMMNTRHIDDDIVSPIVSPIVSSEQKGVSDDTVKAYTEQENQ